MVAAGWRLSRPQAGRALRLHAAEFGHRLFGLPAPAREPSTGAGDLRPGVAERLAIGLDHLRAGAARARGARRRRGRARDVRPAGRCRRVW